MVESRRGVYFFLTHPVQRSAKARPKTVHIDKLKEFFGKPPKKWPVPDESFVDEEYSPNDVVVRGSEERVKANLPESSEEERMKLDEVQIENSLGFSEVIRPFPNGGTNVCLTQSWRTLKSAW